MSGAGDDDGNEADPTFVGDALRNMTSPCSQPFVLAGFLFRVVEKRVS